MSVPSSLVLAAHGTRDPAGIAELDRLASLVALRLPGVAVRVGYVDVLGPSVASVLSSVDGPVTLVPLFLACGYHVQADIPAAVAQAGRDDLTVTAALGPDPALVDVALDRLRTAGAHLVGGHSAQTGSAQTGSAHIHAAPSARTDSLQTGSAHIHAAPSARTDSAQTGSARTHSAHSARTDSAQTHSVDTVVLAAAGSADPRAIADVRRAAQLLGAPAGFIATASPSVAEVVRAMRARQRRSRIAIASWLLAPGFFHTRLADAGADIVAEPLGAHPAVADLIVRRVTASSLAACGLAPWSPGAA